MNYEKDVTIDVNALDVEWIDQPRILLRYAKNAAECRSMLDSAKEELDYTKAELDKKVRTNPEKYGLEKVTEGAIQNIILTSKEYQAANDNFLKAKFDVDIAQAAVQAINQRKDALENLVKLHGMQYFAGPKVPRDLSKEWEDRQKQSSANNAVAKMTRNK